MADLTRAWTSAAAALPVGWEIAGLVIGPTAGGGVPAFPHRGWIAWARGRDGEQCEGIASTPHAALLDLARELSKIRAERANRSPADILAEAGRYPAPYEDRMPPTEPDTFPAGVRRHRPQATDGRPICDYRDPASGKLCDRDLFLRHDGAWQHTAPLGGPAPRRPKGKWGQV